MLICEGQEEAVVDYINQRIVEDRAAGHRVGVLATDRTRTRYEADLILSVGDRDQEETIAHNLFHVLREFDESSVDIIYSECFEQEKLGMAIMNRLMKAAGYRRIRIEG